VFQNPRFDNILVHYRDHPQLTWHITLTTVYAVTCYTVILNAYQHALFTANESDIILWKFTCHLLHSSRVWTAVTSCSLQQLIIHRETTSTTIKGTCLGDYPDEPGPNLAEKK